MNAEISKHKSKSLSAVYVQTARENGGRSDHFSGLWVFRDPNLSVAARVPKI
jgi:hypothetical protein